MKINKKILEDINIIKNKNLNIDVPDDLVLQFGFNANCNCRCKFCSQGDIKNIPKKLINQELLYKYALPLYPKTAVLVPTAGEITAVKEGFEYLKFIHENYKHINIFIESNGIDFNQDWQDLAIDNLMNCHFSLNAIDGKSFSDTVWSTPKADFLFNKIIKNITSYIEKLKNNNLSEFIPTTSYILNSTNLHLIKDFCAQSISLGCNKVIFYFDTREFYIYDHVTYSDKKFIDAITTLIELEKILEPYIKLYYRLFFPVSGLEFIESIKKKCDKNVLISKYEDIVNMVNKTLTHDEIMTNAAQKRVNFGKKYYLVDGQTNGVTFDSSIINGKKICKNPWNHLRITAENMLEVCGWREYKNTYNLYNIININGTINWNSHFNNLVNKKLRLNFINNKFPGCLDNCPGYTYI